MSLLSCSAFPFLRDHPIGLTCVTTLLRESHDAKSHSWTDTGETNCSMRFAKVGEHATDKSSTIGLTC